MAHVTIAVSERSFKKSLDLIQQSFVFKRAGSTSGAGFSAGYDVQAHLANGTIDIRSDGSVKISELDLVWDRLIANVGFNIPKVCVGGWCIDLPWPVPDICLPEWCFFEADPDINIPINLAPFVRQEISLTASLATRHWDPSSAGTPGFVCQLVRDVFPASVVNDLFPINKIQWHVHLTPGPIDIDLFDFADAAGDLFENLVTSAITAILPDGWVRDAVLLLIGGIADLIRFVLDIPDDIGEWLSDLFNVSLDLLGLIAQVLGEVFGACLPIYQIDDPFTLLGTTAPLGSMPALIPVRIPIRSLDVSANDAELILSANFGV
jgi:hypothetical protein